MDEQVNRRCCVQCDNGGKGSLDSPEPDAVMETIMVRGRLHEHVQSVLDVIPSAEAFYRIDGREALVLYTDHGTAEGSVISVRLDGSTCSADVGEWETGYDA